MRKALEIYMDWYALLLTWASAVVPVDVAKKVSSRAMGKMFLWAASGMETEEGPYQKSMDTLHSLLSSDLAVRSPEPLAKMFQTLPRPCRRQLYDIAMLYSGVYHAVYGAHLEISGREHIALLISNWTPKLVSVEEAEAKIMNEWGAQHPLRRVFEAFNGHTHDGELICEAADGLWESEYQKGRRWLAESQVENGEW